MAQEERRLAAIVSLDVAGYSRLMGADEAGTLSALKAHRRATDEIVARHRGRTVSTAGDGVLLEFASVVGAVECAVEVQRAMAERNAALAERQKMLYRVGINLGDVIVDGDDIYGDGVNVAARLENLATPGGICVSRTVREQVRDKLVLEFEDLGAVEVKNIARPVRAFRLRGDPSATTSVAEPELQPADPAKLAYPLPEKPSIAVLAFDNLSGDPQQEHLCDGLSEEIIAALSCHPDLFVIARNSSFTYKGRPVKVQQVAEDLGVRHVLEGSVRRAGDRLRVTAQLVDALSGSHVWSERYDRVLTDLFAVIDDITLNICAGVDAQLATGPLTRTSRLSTGNLESWLLCRQATGHATRYTREDNATACRLYEQALAKDPGNLAADLGLAWQHYMAARYHWSGSPQASFGLAVNAAERLLALDPPFPGAYALQAGIHLYKREYNEAIAAGEQALALAPSHFFMAAHQGLVYLSALQTDDAVRLIKLAMRLSPYYPDWLLLNLAYAYLIAERYDETIRACEELLDRAPGAGIAARAHLALAHGCDALGRERKARAAIARAIETYPDYTVGFLRRHLLFRDSPFLEGHFETLHRLGLPEA